ncbi:MAG: hypothetical protein KY445_07815 [Armatimonadetes bacterium]|nr:hypothetical protein [Armatimonadota bacterium]
MTPTLTPEQKHASAPQFGGRPSVALKELKRRLETELPAQVAYHNTRLQLAGNNAYKAPDDVIISPTPTTSKHLHTIFLGYSVRKVNSGMRAFRDTGVVSLFLVNARIAREEQVTDGWDISGIVGETLLPYLSGCVDPAERWAWRELAPLEITVLPEAFSEYSGLAMNYQLIQGPDDLWSVK